MHKSQSKISRIPPPAVVKFIQEELLFTPVSSRWEFRSRGMLRWMKPHFRGTELYLVCVFYDAATGDEHYNIEFFHQSGEVAWYVDKHAWKSGRDVIIPQE